MPAYTIEQARERLQAYLDAEERLLTGGQSATLPNGNQVTLADLGRVQEGIRLWESRVAGAEQAAVGRGRCRNVAPRW